MQEILQERRSQNKQEQIRETVLVYMLPPSQLSISTSTICLEMRRNHKQDVDKLLRLPSAMRWVKASSGLLGLRDQDFGGDFARALLWRCAPFEVDVIWLADFISCQDCQNSSCIMQCSVLDGCYEK